MKIFNLDCHVSVIADLKQIFENLGHEVTSWSISGHNWIFNREKSKVDIINENTWMNLDDDVCERFLILQIPIYIYPFKIRHGGLIDYKKSDFLEPTHPGNWIIKKI